MGIAALLYTKSNLCAQDNDTTSNSAAEVAKRLANPNATIGQFVIPIDYIHYNGDLAGASEQNAMKISLQPSLPYPVKKGQNVFFRPLIPFVVSRSLPFPRREHLFRKAQNLET